MNEDIYTTCIVDIHNFADALDDKQSVKVIKSLCRNAYDEKEHFKLVKELLTQFQDNCTYYDEGENYLKKLKKVLDK